MTKKVKFIDSALLHQLALETIIGLSCDEGINASTKDEVFGCTFGRDTALTVLKILKAWKKVPNTQLLNICKRALLTLVKLQGKVTNAENLL